MLDDLEEGLDALEAAEDLEAWEPCERAEYVEVRSRLPPVAASSDALYISNGEGTTELCVDPEAAVVDLADPMLGTGDDPSAPEVFCE